MVKVKGNIQIENTGKTLEDLTKIISFETQMTESNIDLNDIKKPGIYFFGTGTELNRPCYNGWLMVLNTNNYTTKQICFRYGSKNTNDFNIYVRTNFSNGWSDWHQIS